MSAPGATPLKLRLPATSANLGPGFDALGLAMDFALHVEARAADADRLTCTGRNAEKISDAADNLVLQTYSEVLEDHGRERVPLALALHNEIPLGMGCGSSAAALVAGVALADHFGALKLASPGVLKEAARREGHPDNVAACVLGGFTASAMRGDEVVAATVQAPGGWQLLLVLPGASLSTKVARGLLPENYSKADAITNVQNVALLTAAFAQGNGQLLRAAMEDRMHQPYRAEVCPLLPKLTPLAGLHGVLGVTLSGAGPSVLLVVDAGVERDVVEKQARHALGQVSDVELLWTQAGKGATLV